MLHPPPLARLLLGAGNVRNVNECYSRYSLGLLEASDIILSGNAIGTVIV
jgi:hypothetical protein